ncbi:MAG TPA: OmpA family protein [Prolixibacteraceae bacterium]|nr:OmpA family protein [Prolixibacteraceae bacterium]
MKRQQVKVNRFRIFIYLLVLLIPFGCNSSKTLQGGAAGAGAGGVIGGAIGSKSNNTAKGAILGAVIGGTAGALIGKYMDKQAEELEEDLEGATVERVGEGLKITFESGILFGFDSAELSAQSKQNISELAETLKKYEDTNIIIEGHTDSKGADSYNKELSEKRADSVSDYLISLGVENARINEVGYGENQPIADNSTDIGRSKNRRVEVAVFANEELKEKAREGKLANL